ncbi:MAG: acyl-CoA-like ligand-binding transcription factor [Solirubrobacteraceae bacterium]
MTTALDQGAERRGRRRLRVKRALCESAVALFAEHGYAGTPTAAIAARADYSERTFFRHFARKEDVIFYDLPERLAALQDDFNTSHANAWETVRTTLIANARRWEESDPELTIARVRLFHSEPALHARYLEICQEWEDTVATIIATERHASPANDLLSRLIAAATVGGFRAAFRAWLADTSTSLAAQLNQAFDYLEHDLRP